MVRKTDEVRYVQKGVPVNDILIIDDLFLDAAYRRFLRVYSPVYGEEVERPLSFADLTRAIASLLGREIRTTAAFYTDDMQSSFLSRHLTALERERIESGSVDGQSDPQGADSTDIETAPLDLGAVDLLKGSKEAVFHPCGFVAIEAVRYAAQCAGPVIVADDSTYDFLSGQESVIFIRLGNDETRMPLGVRWQDVSYMFCTAYGVRP